MTANAAVTLRDHHVAKSLAWKRQRETGGARGFRNRLARCAMSQPEQSHPEFSSQRIERAGAAPIQGDGGRKAASVPATITRWRRRLRAVMPKNTARRTMPFATTESARWFSRSTASTRRRLRTRIVSMSNAALRRIRTPDVQALAMPTLEFDQRDFYRRTRFVADAPSRTPLQKIVCSRVRSRTQKVALRDFPFSRRFRMRPIVRSDDVRFVLRRVRRWRAQKMLLSKFPRRGALRFEIGRAFERVSKIPAATMCLNSGSSPSARRLEREQEDTNARWMAPFQLLPAVRRLHRNIASADVRESNEPCAPRPPIECTVREFGELACGGSRRDSSVKAQGTRANSENSSTNNRAAG